MFADLFDDAGRRSVPPMIVAVVMMLQRIEGCSDREAVDGFAFDARWKYAAGGLDFGYPGFVYTVLVDMRARLARSARRDRIFEVTGGPGTGPGAGAGRGAAGHRDRPGPGPGRGRGVQDRPPGRPGAGDLHRRPAGPGQRRDRSGRPGNGRHPGLPGTTGGDSGQAAVYGDAAYGSGELVERVEDAGIYSGIKVQPPPAVKGHFPKDRLAIDLDGQAVTCPAGITAPIRASGRRHPASQASYTKGRLTPAT